MSLQRPGEEPTRILIVDDDLDDIQVFTEALSKLNFPHAVGSAKSIDDLFSILALPPLPHIIFLDINLPGICGLDGLRKLKAHAGYMHIPVLMYSLSNSERDIDEAYVCGAHYYIIKPYSVNNLYQSLKKALKPDWRQAQPIPQRSEFIINEAFT